MFHSLLENTMLLQPFYRHRCLRCHTKSKNEASSNLNFFFQNSLGVTPDTKYSHHKSVRPALYQQVLFFIEIFSFCLFIFLIVWRLSHNISFKIVCCSLFWFINGISKIPWSCKRIEKAVIIILYTVKWNCCSLLEYPYWKYKNSRL